MSKADQPPAHLPEDVAAVWSELAAHVPAAKRGPDFDAYCAQVALQRDCRRRISTEGTIVPDGKQNPVAHPAIAIERAAIEQIRKWGRKYGGRK